MINYKVLGVNSNLQVNDVVTRRPLRVEILHFSGTILNLNGKICNDETILAFPKMAGYRIARLYRGALLQPALNDPSEPVIPYYTFDYITGDVTFDTTQDVTAPDNENIIIELEYYKSIA